ncbi:hypothetical protein JG688_00011566 [Phytophthora aleatoria]|uniref:Uncharacterized protein n=1 Tax=Phytophthora aleatoria TaxID=2496075 RepID=A0A8J5MF21_9STRA|nr:hypothetical protein JG688_00011566 [Phytophthora aleatoria]
MKEFRIANDEGVEVEQILLGKVVSWGEADRAFFCMANFPTALSLGWSGKSCQSVLTERIRTVLTSQEPCPTEVIAAVWR